MKRSYESQLEEGLRDREQQVYLRDREISRLRAQVAELVEAGQDALNVIWAENLVAKKKGNTLYEARTKAVYDKLQAAITAAEGGSK